MADRDVGALLAPLKIGTVADGDYTQIHTDGTLTYVGDATVWDDLSIPLTAGRQGINSKPDFDYTEIGLLFPQNDTDEKAYASRQMSHSKKLDSDIKLHIHYVQTIAAQPTFKVNYRFYNNGSAVPGSWTTISTADGSKGLFSWTTGSILQIATFPAISAPPSEGVSAQLDLIIWREDNDVTGDVLAKYLDIHYEIDAGGSSQEYSK